MESWKLMGCVADEKLILFISIWSLLNFEQYIMITEVLAVPGEPTRRVFWWPGSFLMVDLIRGRFAILLIMYSALVESPVGIKS
jgi:hypothetical protein